MVSVRAAGPGDLGALASLRAQLWPDAGRDEHTKELRAILAREPASTLPLVVFVAELEGRVIGFIETALRSHADGCDPVRPCGFVEGWYVAAEHRGRGVGRALMERACSWAAEHGCTELASDTWLDNETSQLAHAALGFQVVDRVVNYRMAIAPHALPARGSAAVGENAAEGHYGRELAAIHHAHFGMVARGAARELLLRLSNVGFVSGTIVDLAAGTGILSAAVVDAGFEAWGVDLSAAMLGMASAIAPKAAFTTGSLWQVPLPPCVAVAAVGEAFNYAVDASASLAALEARLTCIHQALAPGGLLLFDVAAPGRSGPSGSRSLFWTQGATCLGLTEREQASCGSLTRDLSLFLPEGERYRRAQETHLLRLYAREQVEGLLTQIGFCWERLVSYADFVFPDCWHGYIASKPTTPAART